jgi:hypothetical protein
MSRRVRVHHFVLADVVRPQSQSWRATDLFGASHWLDVPADTEFPRAVARLQVFTRFYLMRAKPTEFRILVSWIDHPNGVPVAIGDFGPFTVSFARDATVRDCSFNLHNLQLQGVGRHSVELVRERKSGWNAGELVPVATTYFVVER